MARTRERVSNLTDASTLVIDCDAGQDDAVAILLALGNLDLFTRLAMITTVAGNSPIDVTTRNACQVVGFAERVGRGSVPIHRGMTRALVRPITSYFRADQADLPGWNPIVDQSDVHPDGAIDALINLARRSAPKSITVCALGPLTNIAMAILLDETFATRLGQVVWMGGSLGRGNSTPAAEFNAHADPEALRIVLASGVDVTIVPSEIGEIAAMTSDRITTVADLDTPLASVCARLLVAMGNDHDHGRYAETATPMYDPTAVALMADPSMFAIAETHVSIDTTDGPSLGATHVDLDGRGDAAPNCRVALDIDTDRFHHFVLDALQTTARPGSPCDSQ